MRIPDTDWAENIDRLGHGYMVFVSHRDLRDVIDDCLTIGKNFDLKKKWKKEIFVYLQVG
jgi:hypothetical protein